MAETCLAEYNERSSVVVTASFVDEDGSPVAPDSADYRIDDKASRTTILDWTTITSPSDEEEVLITADQNRIIKPRKAFEIRTITFRWQWTGTLGLMENKSQYEYRVNNLYGVVDVPSASVSPSTSASPST